jgi:hypothetical protein
MIAAWGLRNLHKFSIKQVLKNHALMNIYYTRVVYTWVGREMFQNIYKINVLQYQDNSVLNLVQNLVY